MHTFDLLTILGPTACGKTALAVKTARLLDGEIISADSRQIYRKMDIGTGKDLADYSAGGVPVPYHLIDIAEPGYRYNLFEYQRDFLQAYEQIVRQGKRPILCGGTGLYLESVLKGYRMSPVPEDPILRSSLKGKSMEELAQILSHYKQLHNTTDLDSPARAIRAIEVHKYYADHQVDERPFPHLRSLTIGIKVERDIRRERITQRLKARLAQGLIEEVKGLLAEGIKPESLIYYGLEYKYVTLHVTGQLTYEEMFRQLEIAIHQFAKRQMTWFRGMERRGIPIHWIDGNLPVEKQAEEIAQLYKKGEEDENK